MITLLALTWFLQAPGPRPTFRADTTVVPVYATVTDDDDRLVPNLAAGDFEILDDGRPQSLAVFANDVQPLTIVVMLDTSASMTPVLDELRAAAEQFVIRLLPADQARVCVFNDRIQFMSDFTHDRDELAETARDVDYGTRTRLYDGFAASLDALRDVEGRKVILVLSDGDDTASKTRRHTIVDRARAENVMVYGIGFESRVRNDDDEIVRTMPDPGLRKLAAETGGGYLTVSRARRLTSTFTHVLQELHSQYLLGFAPETNDGRVHQLVVRANGKTLKVRARRSYLAAAAHVPSNER